MEHTTESVIFLCGHLRNLGCNIYFLSKKGRFLGCSRPGCKLPASWMKQIHSAQWPGEEGAILSVSGNPYTLHLCPSTQGDSLCALIPSEDYQRMAPFLDVLLQLNQATVLGTLQSPAQQRNLLTSQLANFGSLTAELSASIQDLGYTPNAWRVAILCSISMTSDHHLKDAVQSAQINAGFFSDCMEAFDGYSQDDVFGSISNNQFLIFRSVSSGSALDNFKELDDFLTKLTEYLWEHQADNPVFGIGSAYNSLTQLNMSYREAAFLLTNHAFYNRTVPTDCLSADICWNIWHIPTCIPPVNFFSGTIMNWPEAILLWRTRWLPYHRMIMFCRILLAPWAFTAILFCNGMPN